MRYLLYCIFRSGEHAIMPAILGVASQPVFFITNDGLSAVVSRVPDSDLFPDTSQMLVYGRVIEAFHANATVIPMRYGSLFERGSHIIQLLRERHQEYIALLTELMDCVEMGIRVLPRNVEGRFSNAELCPSNSLLGISLNAKSGRAYLTTRKDHYDRRARLADEHKALLERCRGAFAGVFVKCKTESPSLGVSYSAFRVPLASLYFLIHRQDAESFHRVFRELSSRESAKLLLSGPWPPYNFVELSKTKTGAPPAPRDANE